MREFERYSPDSEILDLDSLMALDELAESKSELFMQERDVKKLNAQ